MVSPPLSHQPHSRSCDHSPFPFLPFMPYVLSAPGAILIWEAHFPSNDNITSILSLPPLSAMSGQNYDCFFPNMTPRFANTGNIKKHLNQMKAIDCFYMWVAKSKYYKSTLKSLMIVFGLSQSYLVGSEDEQRLEHRYLETVWRLHGWWQDVCAVPFPVQLPRWGQTCKKTFWRHPRTATLLNLNRPCHLTVGLCVCVWA